MYNLFKKLNPRKAPKPDCVSPSTLRHCADIFNTSLESYHVSACFKSSTIVPIAVLQCCLNILGMVWGVIVLMPTGAACL